MPKYCPECGGELGYDPRFKSYSCRSCGVTFSYQELLEAYDKLGARESEEELKRKERRDYLKWWLKSREEKKRG